MKPATFIWLLIVAAICLPIVVSVLSQLLTAAAALMVLVLVVRAVWFFTR